MKHNVLFGPAGSPVNYKGAAYKAPKYISEEGLDSYEYQTPYGIRIGEKSAVTLKEESQKHDVLVSMHGPYYINLCAKDEDKLDKSIGYLISLARVGEWMGAYREIIGDFYRSANGYSQICKNEMFGDPIKFSPYEVQIMEHIMEHADQHRNMKWYANRLGLSQATYSKYVRKLKNYRLIHRLKR